MKVYDISDMESLLENFLSYGFTLECLSRGTNTSIELIEECVSMGEKFKDPRKVKDAFSFLITVNEFSDSYKDDDYYKNLLESVCSLYKIPKAAIAKFLGLDEQQFNTFLQNPEAYPDGFQRVTKMQWILHLFSNDKRSYYEITGKYSEEDDIQMNDSSESMEGVEFISVPIYIAKEET